MTASTKTIKNQSNVLMGTLPSIAAGSAVVSNDLPSTAILSLGVAQQRREPRGSRRAVRVSHDSLSNAAPSADATSDGKAATGPMKGQIARSFLALSTGRERRWSGGARHVRSP